MSYKDLRARIEQLEAEGELRRIKAEVDWDLEIGGITRTVLDQRKFRPALLFENIKDYKDGRCTKFFTGGMFSFGKVALFLGLPKDTHPREIFRFVKDRFQQRIKPVIVDSGPAKENILRGDQINLYDFPVPRWRPLDGGRYIITSCMVITRDPDSGVQNIGMYRGMITSPNSIPVLLTPTQHWGLHFRKYEQRGQPMPVAVAIGVDEPILMSACAPVLHPDYSEYELAGSLVGEPIPLVKCETSDLEVPANSEIVIEGTISPDPSTFEMEGPFGEYTGYYGGLASPKPTIKVDCITHRNDPILRGTWEGGTPGRPAETSWFAAPPGIAATWNFLEMVGVPGILDVSVAPGSMAAITRVRIKKQHRAHASQVALALWISPAAMGGAGHKFVVVVDEDIDIYDESAVGWAMAYRVNPGMGDIVMFPDAAGSVLDPSTPPADRDPMKWGHGRWTRVLIDATISWDLEPEAQYGGERFPPLASTLAPEVEQLVKRRWKEYGID
jgi:4-hydroxy-3-polyprenylbenzoate decarboxylase